MLYTVMQHIHNYFPTGKVYEGSIAIKDGNISLPFLQEGCFFSVEGSLFNDGVYEHPHTLKDETFNGCVSLLQPPKEFLDIVQDIEAFETKNKERDMSLTSESFGGYSYHIATNSNGVAVSWMDVFKSKLNTWRKV